MNQTYKTENGNGWQFSIPMESNNRNKTTFMANELILTEDAR